jgi:hypothetical protein
MAVQVALALQLPVTCIPLIKATSSRARMGTFKSSWALASAAWAALALIFTANLLLLGSQMAGISHIGADSRVAPVLPPGSLLGADTKGGKEEGLALASWRLVQPPPPLPPPPGLKLRPGQYLERGLDLAWHSPLRFTLLLGFVVACAAFLALVG